MADQKKGWCFTINNYTEEEVETCWQLPERTSCSYTMMGFEIGDEGTAHIQGYAYFPGKVTFGAIKKWLPRAHLEPQMGTCDQAINYCMKDGAYLENGSRPQKGARNDIKEMKEDIDNGMNMQEVADKYTGNYLRYSNAIEKLMNMKCVKNDTLVYVYTGDELDLYIADTYESVMVIHSSKDFYHYKDEDVCVIDLMSDITELEILLLSRGKGIKTNMGFQSKTVYPKHVCINNVNKWKMKSLPRTDNINEWMEIQKELAIDANIIAQ